MATHFGILAWRIPWTEASGRLQSIGLQESDMTVRLSIRTYLRCVSCKQHTVVFLNPSLTIMVFSFNFMEMIIDIQHRIGFRCTVRI